MKQALAEKYRPLKLQNFAGLQQPRAVLKAFMRDPYPAAFLFLGSSGTGKTAMALAIAAEIGAEVHHVPSRMCDLEMVDRLAHDCQYYPMNGAHWHVTIVDECDQATTAAQLALLSKLDSTAGLPNTIWFFTANETKKLEERFLSRVRVLYFEPAPAPEAITWLDRVWHAEGGNGNAPDLAMLYERAQGNLRTALMDLEMELLQLEEVSV